MRFISSLGICVAPRCVTVRHYGPVTYSARSATDARHGQAHFPGVSLVPIDGSAPLPRRRCWSFSSGVTPHHDDLLCATQERRSCPKVRMTWHLVHRSEIPLDTDYNRPGWQFSREACPFFLPPEIENAGERYERQDSGPLDTLMDIPYSNTIFQVYLSRAKCQEAQS